MVYFLWYLVNPHVETVQNTYGKGVGGLGVRLHVNPFKKLLSVYRASPLLLWTKKYGTWRQSKIVTFPGIRIYQIHYWYWHWNLRADHKNALKYYNKAAGAAIKTISLCNIFWNTLYFWSDCFETNRTWASILGLHVLFVSKRSDQK